MLNSRKKYKFYYFVGTVINRALALNEGYVELTQKGNYLCAIPLIRMQLDNALICYSGLLVNDLDDYFDYIDKGKDIHKYKDKRGNMMFEKYLKQELNKEFRGVSTIYSETSKYVHLTTKHMNASFKSDNGKTVSKIGDYNNIFTPEERKAIDANMIEVNNILLNTFVIWSKAVRNDLSLQDQLKLGISLNIMSETTQKEKQESSTLIDDFEPVK